MNYLLGMAFGRAGFVPEDKSAWRNGAFIPFLAFEIMVFLPFETYLFAFHRDWLWGYISDTRIVSWLGLVSLLVITLFIGFSGFFFASFASSRKPGFSFKPIVAAWLIAIVVAVVYMRQKLLFYGYFDAYNMIIKGGTEDAGATINIFNSPLILPLFYFLTITLTAGLFGAKTLNAAKRWERFLRG